MAVLTPEHELYMQIYNDIQSTQAILRDYLVKYKGYVNEKASVPLNDFFKL